MILDAIIEPISDLSTVVAQAAVERIAERSSLERDGWILTVVRVLIACVVFLALAVGVPISLIALIGWLGLKLLFP